MDFLKDLHDRGILNAVTNEEKAKKFCPTAKPIGQNFKS